MRVPSKKLLPKNHASTTRDRLDGFARNFQHGFATEPEGTHIIISPWGPIECPIAGGQFLRFPEVPPWEAGKFFTSDLGESCHTVQGDDSDYGSGVYFLWKRVFGTKKPVYAISGQSTSCFEVGQTRCKVQIECADCGSGVYVCWKWFLDFENRFLS